MHCTKTSRLILNTHQTHTHTHTAAAKAAAAAQQRDCWYYIIPYYFNTIEWDWGWGCSSGRKSRYLWGRLVSRTHIQQCDIISTVVGIAAHLSISAVFTYIYVYKRDLSSFILNLLFIYFFLSWNVLLCTKVYRVFSLKKIYCTTAPAKCAYAENAVYYTYILNSTDFHHSPLVLLIYIGGLQLSI